MTCILQTKTDSFDKSLLTFPNNHEWLIKHAVAIRQNERQEFLMRPHAAKTLPRGYFKLYTCNYHEVNIVVLMKVGLFIGYVHVGSVYFMRYKIYKEVTSWGTNDVCILLVNLLRTTARLVQINELSIFKPIVRTVV